MKTLTKQGAISQIRDIEIHCAYGANSFLDSDNAVYNSNYRFEAKKLDDWDEARVMDRKYVAVAKYDGGTFYLFSSMDKAKAGAPNAKSYVWVLVDGALK